MTQEGKEGFEQAVSGTSRPGGVRASRLSSKEVLSTVQSNGAPQEVIDQIRNAGPDTFNSPEEVLQAVQGRL